MIQLSFALPNLEKLPICEIGTINTTITDCNDDGNFFVILNFEYVDVSLSFNVHGNGTDYGNFSYGNLPIEIGPLEGDCITSYEFVVEDNELEGCSNFAEIGTICCEMETCFIGALNVETTDCNDDGNFFAFIDFEHSGTTSSFSVLGNGNDYGDFLYSNLPIEIGPLAGNCETNYEFAVHDNDIDGCSNSTGIGQICCEEACNIGPLNIDITSCNSELLSILVNFEYENVNPAGFDVWINDVFYDFLNYEDLPFAIENLENTEDLTITVCNNDDNDCCSSATIELPCEPTEECSIGEINVETTECNDDGNFFAIINFEHSNTSLSFDVFGNGVEYGNFLYENLPIEIGPLDGNCETNYEFVVVDHEIEGCNSDIGIGQICCENEECFIGALNVETTECNDDGNFFAVINFEHSNTSLSFDIFGNGVEYGNFLYENLPIEIGPLAGNCETNYEFVVIDHEIDGCNSDVSIGQICCENEECYIGEINVETTVCNEDGNFFAVINFEYANTTTSFSVMGNATDYGDFLYSELPITIGPLAGNCETNYEFGITDNDIEGCFAGTGIGQICCDDECLIGELNIETTDCNDDGNIFAIINFEHSNTTTSFSVTGNGIDYGDFLYANLPIEIGPLAGDCLTSYNFEISDNDIDGCESNKNIGAFCCSDECVIGEIIIETTACNDNEQFFAIINFQHWNTSTNFSLTGNATDYGDFLYSELPITIGPLDGNCETKYEFVITDNDIDGCFLGVNIGEVCCDDECFIGEISVETTECNDDGNFFAVINFEHSNTTTSFSVMGNATDYGDFLYSELPITIGPLAGNCETNYEFGITDNDIEGCFAGTGIGQVCCDNEDCFIGELNIETSDCNDDGNIFAFINFEHTNTTTSFSVTGNGTDYGDFLYANLPIEIGPLAGDCITNYNFEVSDNDIDGCESNMNIGAFCCSDECSIGQINVETTECNNDNQFFAVINFQHWNTTTSFSVMGNGTDYGDYLYADLPITIGPLAGNCETNYEFVITDNDIEGCFAGVDIGQVCCENEECVLGPLNVDITSCNSEEFSMLVNFEYENVGAGFDVWLNDNYYGFLSYDDLPISIEDLENSEEDLTITICNNDSDCCTTATLELPCEESGNCFIGELNVETTECNDDGNFFAVINFEHSNTTTSFSVMGNGTDYGDFLYSELPITIGPLAGNCETNYEFGISDNDIEGCNSGIDIGMVCCDNEECDIFELSVEITECNDDDNFFAIINFEYVNTSSSFQVVGNGVNYGSYSYENLPIEIGPLDGDCITEYEFVVLDSDQESCNEGMDVGVICCDPNGCAIGDVKADLIACDDNVYSIEVSFEFENVGDSGFDLWLDDEFYATLGYDAVPFSIENLPIQEEDLLITICDAFESECCSSTTFEIPCTVSLEELQSLEVEYIMQENILYIENKSNTASTFKVFTITGQLIATNVEIPAHSTGTISLNNLSSGVYILFGQNDKQIFTGKFVNGF